MAIIGIIGIADTTKKMVDKGLADLQANVGQEEFWAVVSVPEDATESVGYGLTWLIQQGVAFDLVIDPSMVEATPAEVRDAADQTFETKTTEMKVVDHLLANGGTHLLVLAGSDEPTDAVWNAAVKAKESGLKVLDLADGCVEIAFEDDAQDAPAPEDAEERPDFESLGTKADDESDAAAIAELESMAEANGIDHTAIATYSEVAVLLAELFDADAPAEEEPEPKAPPKKAGTKAAPAAAKPADEDEGTGWTEEALAKKDLKQLRALAAQSGVEGAGKMPIGKLREALLGLSAGEAPAAEEPAAPATKPVKGKVTGTALANAANTSNVEANEALQQIISGLIRLVTALTSE